MDLLILILFCRLKIGMSSPICPLEQKFSIRSALLGLSGVNMDVKNTVSFRFHRSINACFLVPDDFKI